MNDCRLRYNVPGPSLSNDKKRVAILGAGPAGIVSAKIAVECGLIPVVFDRKSKPGGLWSSGTAIWEGMHTNVSVYSVMFSDFPWPENNSIFPSARDVYYYLLRYINYFGLENYFQLLSNVESVKQMPNKKWLLLWTDFVTGDKTLEVFDYLICSTGVNCKPIMPNPLNMENFQGITMHSADYRSNDSNLKNKRVVVVGNSYSGVEISAHLVGHAKSVANIFNRPYLVMPRLLKIKANNSHENTYNIIPIDLFYGRELCFGTTCKEEERKAKIELYSKLCPHQTNKDKCHPAMYYELDDDEPIREAVTDNYYPFILQGKIKPKKAKIVFFEQNGIYLTDGSFEPCDVVLFCTGYKISLDYFDECILKKLKYDPNYERYPIILYKYTFHPDLDNLAMVGEANGLFFAGFELQARWAFQVFTGEKKLPSKEFMEDRMRQDELNRSSVAKNQYPHGIYNEIIDNLAAEVDALPNFKLLKKSEPRLFNLLWNNGTIPAHFCFNNPKLKDYSIQIMEEVDRIIRKKYRLSNEEIETPSSYLIASRFSKYFNIPMHLFKA